MGLMANATSTTVTLYWSLGFDGNSNITEFLVTYASTSDHTDNGTLTVLGDMVTEVVVSSLRPSTTYSFSVTVTNGIGTSGAVGLTVTTDPLTSPDELRVLSLGSSETTIAWNAVWNLSTQYQVMLTENDECNYVSVTYTVPSSGETMEVYTVTGLQPVTNYTISVTTQLILSNGLNFTSQPSESISFITAASGKQVDILI